MGPEYDGIYVCAVQGCWCSVHSKIHMSLQFFMTLSGVKFHEDLFSSSQFICMKMDRHREWF